MSEAPEGTLLPNTVFYQLLKAKPILNANGAPDYAVIAQSQDFATIMNAAIIKGDCVVIASLVVTVTLPAPQVAKQ